MSLALELELSSSKNGLTKKLQEPTALKWIYTPDCTWIIIKKP